MSKINSEEKIKEKEENFGVNPEEIVQAGLCFGHKTSRTHPKMKPFLWGVKNNIQIIDQNKTAEKLNEALKFIQELISQNKTLLLIGTKIQIQDLVKEIAENCGIPFINIRWLGGTFTNFRTIQKRLNHFKDLEQRKVTGELEKYPKKERAEMEKELRELEINFGGIKNLEKLPDAIFILDMKKDALAIKEAKKKGVIVIAIADTNVDPTLADYPIPANDDAISSMKYILDKMKDVIIKAKSKQ